MGIDAILYAKIRKQEDTYNRIGFGLRFRYYTEPDYGEPNYENIIKFVGMDSAVYLNLSQPFELHARYVNWCYDLSEALRQINEAIIYYQKQDKEEDKKYKESSVCALETLKRSILDNIDRWECILLVDDCSSLVDGDFIWDDINKTNRYEVIPLNY